MSLPNHFAAFFIVSGPWCISAAEPLPRPPTTRVADQQGGIPAADPTGEPLLGAGFSGAEVGTRRPGVSVTAAFGRRRAVTGGRDWAPHPHAAPPAAVTGPQTGCLRGREAEVKVQASGLFSGRPLLTPR